MTQHADSPSAANSSDVGDGTLKLQDEARPPWLVLFVGFFLIDGLFGFLAFVLQLPAVDNLLYILPPFSFMWWYAYEDPLGWVHPMGGFFSLTIPVLQLAVAWSIWRTPARTQRLVLIVGIALALEAALWLVPHRYGSRGYDWHFASAVWGLANLALPVFAIWFVRWSARLARPEATLISAYLLVVGVPTLTSAVTGFIDRGISTLFTWFRWSALWFYLEAFPMVDLVTSVLVIVCGLLFRRTFVPVRAVSAILILANLLNLAWWSFEWGSGSWGSYLPHALAHLSRVCPLAANLVIAIALARFACRNVALLNGPEPLCRTCHYNLTGNVSGVCPECGTKVEQRDRASGPPPA